MHKYSRAIFDGKMLRFKTPSLAYLKGVRTDTEPAHQLGANCGQAKIRASDYHYIQYPSLGT